MRNCFVPGCDAFCKKNNIVQRKMFLPPVKLLERWAELLPNKRSFKKHDRVCERHFNEEDIIQYWEANIKGQIHLTPRDKPKLRENAIPCKNLPSKDGSEEEVLLKKQNEKVQILSQKIIAPAKRKLDERREKALVKKSGKKQKTKLLIGRKVPAEVQEVAIDVHEANVPPASIEIEPECALMTDIIAEAVEINENSQENVNAFESIYEEAFDVTLPSLLWGIHRDPDVKFIVFSEFSQSTMTTSKLLHITNTCHCETFINNKRKSSMNLHHEKLTTDFVSTLLDELDKEPLTSS